MVAGVIKSVSEVTTALITLQEKMKNLRGLKPTESADSNPQNNNQTTPNGDTFIFAGTTDDVLKAIEEGRNKKKK